MYCEFFGLRRSPFNNTPDPTFYFSTPEHQEALATLEYAVMQRKGFVLVTGEVGAGKTLIGRMFLRNVESQAATATISQTYLSPRQLLEALCHELELPLPDGDNPLRIIQRLQEYLLDRFSRDGRVVVLIDEAQNLPVECFETLRMLGNLEADDAKLIQICLLGQPELRERFRRPELKQLDQRLFCRFHLPVLTREQTAAYIHHRMRIAGNGDPEVFTPIACERIYVVSGGTPRLINTLCDNALLTAYGQNLRVIDDRIMRQVTDREALRAAPIERRATTESPAAASREGARPSLEPAPAPAAESPMADADPHAPCPDDAVCPTADRAAPPQEVQTGSPTDDVGERLEHRSEDIRRLTGEMRAALRETTAALEALERDPASGQLENLRLQHQANVAGLVRQFNEVSRSLREIKESILPATQQDDAATQAGRAEIARRVLRMARDLGGLRQEMLESCGRIHALLNRLAARPVEKPVTVPVASNPVSTATPQVQTTSHRTPESAPMNRVEPQEAVAAREPAVSPEATAELPPTPAESIAESTSKHAEEPVGFTGEDILGNLEPADSGPADIQAMTRRLEHLERRLVEMESAPRQPVQMQLMPEFSVQLAGLIETARREHASFSEDLERAAVIAASLQEASGQIQEVMQDWVANAATVQQQSDQLRASSKVAAEILNAMRRCNTVLEKKISSERWQVEIERGETLTGRMEQATRAARTVFQQLSGAIGDMEHLRSEADAWSARSEEARQVGERLNELLNDAQNTTTRFEEALESRRGMLTAIARNTAGLVKVIDAARRGDEDRPAAGDVPEESRLAEVNWPRIRAPQVAAS